MKYGSLRRYTLKKGGRSVTYSQSLWTCFLIYRVGNIIPTSKGWRGLNVRKVYVSEWRTSSFWGPCYRQMGDKQKELPFQPLLLWFAFSRVSRGPPIFLAGVWRLKTCRAGLWSWPLGTWIPIRLMWKGMQLLGLRNTSSSLPPWSESSYFFFASYHPASTFIILNTELLFNYNWFCSGEIRPLSLQLRLRKTRIFVDFAD